MSRFELVDELGRSPAGAALLDSLERTHRDDARPFEALRNSDPVAVWAAVDAVGTMLFGDLVQHLVSAAEHIVGPWMSDAMANLTAALKSAPARTEIAEAVVSRFSPELNRTVALEEQQWWLAANDLDHAGPVFAGRRHDYCCGEFSSNSVRTVSAPPSQVHDDLVDVWEIFPGPISRWQVPVRSEARVYEIHRPSDWANLVAQYPSATRRPHGGPELPGPNQDTQVAAEVQRSTRGVAARVGDEVVMPDWTRVAGDYDGIHLSWAGMATCEGRVIDVADLGPGIVTMIRYWGSERSMWLNDVFDTPTPLSAPSLTGRVNGDFGIADDPHRRAVDAQIINTALDRTAVAV